MDICLLHIDEQRIGLPMDSVREVLFHPSISRVPASPSFFLGVTGFRGQCLPVIDLPSLLKFASETKSQPRPSPVSPRSRVVVTQCPEAEVGIQVDLVDRIEADAGESGTDANPTKLLHFLSCPEEPEARLLNRQQLQNLIIEHTHPVLPAASNGSGL